jgi:REP element-mobilizing transposase RayT
MSRPLRIELAGGLYHVTSRGDRREDVFLNDDDRGAWLDIIGETCKRYNWLSHGWCQMTNHYHVIIETAEANLSQGMRHLNGVYTQWVNRTYMKSGHVFQGRYKAILVEKDAHLLELARYVVLNPVRARMAGDAGEWPWSSYLAMVGRQSAPDWLQTDWLLGQFGRNRADAIAVYIDFVRAGVGLPSIWEELRANLYLGSEAFVARVTQPHADDRVAEIPRLQRRPLANPLSDYQRRFADSGIAMAEAYTSGDYSMTEIAAHFGVHYATVSRAVARHRKTAPR